MDKSKILVVFGLIGFIGIFVLKVIGIELAILIILGIGGWFVVQYNRLQSLSQEIQESHSNIQIAMKKRFDLANKLMEISANYADHETMTHLGVAKLEAVPSNNNSTNLEDGMFSRFMMMSRAYPELQANQTYQVLMKQLEDIESNLQHKRETYNVKVRTYNTKRTAIPMIFLSDQLGFKAAPYFDAISPDVIAGLKDFTTADGEQLKSFISGLGNQVVAKSEYLTNGLGKVTKNYLGKSTSTESNDSKSTEFPNNESNGDNP